MDNMNSPTEYMDAVKSEQKDGQNDNTPAQKRKTEARARREKARALRSEGNLHLLRKFGAKCRYRSIPPLCSGTPPALLQSLTQGARLPLTGSRYFPLAILRGGRPP